MSQQAFFSTANSTSIVLNTSDTTSTSVVYQSTGTPTFYTTTGSPFQSGSTYLPSQTSEERKDYITVIPAGVHLSTASGIIPVNVSSCFTSPTECNEKSCITQMVQLTPIQTLPSALPSEEHQMIYEPVYVDQQEASTSGMLNDLHQISMETNSQAPVETEQKFDPSVKTNSVDTASLVGSDISDNSLQLKRMKQAEAARQRYQRLTPEERKEINAKRTLAQKRKRQRDKEIEELEGILRKSKDIVDDPAVNEQLREKRIRARRAEAARLRYQRMSSEERRIYNQKRRMRQLGLQGQKKAAMDDEKVRQRILEQNAKKAEAARLRYHRMTEEEKRIYNQRRTEAFRRRRIQEEILLSTPAGRISAEALNKAQQIMMRNAKRAEAARLRYQRMTPEQRKAYNQKRSSAKKARERMSQANAGSNSNSTSANTSGQPSSQVQVNGDFLQNVLDSAVSEEALNALEKDVVRRTRQANMVLMKQRRSSVVDHVVMVSTAPDGTQTIIPATTLEDGKQVFHIPRNSTNHALETINSGTVTIVDPSSNKQEPLQLATVPILSMPEQVAEQNERSGETHQLVPATISQLPLMPQLAELHPLRPPSTSTEAVQQDSQMQRNHTQPQQQPIIFAVQEPQQSVAHQIIVADLNQPTGVVLSSMSNQIRSRGRPPIYAAAAVAIQQQQQSQEQEQQGSVVLVPATQLPLPVDSSASSTKLQQNNRHSKTSNPVTAATTGRQDILAVATAAVGNTVELTPQQKLEIQRAKRAERARMRYHNMSEEERRNFNARRANALKRARMRDEQLCMLAETAELNGGTLDEETLAQIEEAQRRRARRAEAARLKYHRMSSEERRQYNAVRDAQRRQRKREQEAAALSRQQQHQEQQKQSKQQEEQPQQQPAQREEVNEHQGNDSTNQTLIYDTYIQYEQPLEQNWER